MSTSTESYIARENTIHQSKLFLLPLILVGRNNHSIKFIFLLPTALHWRNSGHKTYNFLRGPGLFLFCLGFLPEGKKVVMSKPFTVSFLEKQNLYPEKWMCKYSAPGWELLKNHPAENLSHGIMKIAQKQHQLKNRTVKI